jgi:allantoin racemase
MSRILLLNPNTSGSMTERMLAAARDAAGPGTVLLATQPSWGTSSVEGYYDGYVSVAAALDRLAQLREQPEPGLAEPWDAIIWAGFGDAGREGLQELLDVPVISIAEAAAHVAMLLGRRFGIVTTLARARGQIEDALLVAGLLERCAGIWSIDAAVLESAAGEAETIDRCLDQARAALAAGAEVVCLGSGAFAGTGPRLTAMLGAPVVDGVCAAVALAETCIRLGVSTSKIGALAAPRAKDRPGWPMPPPPQQPSRPE